MAACQPAPQQLVGVGDMIAIDVARREVTIRHDAIVGFAAAATTRFTLDDAVTTEATVGQRVRFVLRQHTSGMQVTDVTVLAEGNPGVHDHTPHHGGVVGMIGMTHLEARAERDGRVQVYLTDRYRRPLPLADVHGSVTLSLPEAKRTLPLTVVDDALEAMGPVPTGDAVHVEVQLERAGESLAMTFQLPLASDQRGAAGIPAEGCVAPQGARAGVPQPRCVLKFPRPIGVLAATADASRLLVAGADIGVSAWQVEPPRFLVGFESAPAVVLTEPEPPHIEVANAIALSPDGARAVVALEHRLLVHDVGSGRLRHARTHPNGIVRTVAWLPGGDDLLVTSFYDAAARVVTAEDGQERRTFRVAREAAAVAVNDAGDRLAVASEYGPIALFDCQTGALLRTLSEPSKVTRAMAFVGSGIVAASDDGLLRWWDLASDVPPVTLATTAVSAVARERNGTRVVSAARDGTLRVHDVARAGVVTELAWHQVPLTAVAWAGNAIISADADGHVAFWDVP